MNTQSKTPAETLKDLPNQGLNPLQFARAREIAIIAGLKNLATSLGITFKTALQVNSNGELLLAVQKEDAGPMELACGAFGEKFAALLNQHRPRTGVPGPNLMCPESGWCYLNHFEAEKLVLSQTS